MESPRNQRDGLGRWAAAWTVVVIVTTPGAAGADVFDPTLVDDLHEPQGEHIEQQELTDLVAEGEFDEAFELAFEVGDELFEVTFNGLDGVGGNVGEGQRFTRVPRADLSGSDQWANHFPTRETGPNAAACVSCHNQPEDDGAGPASANVQRDPRHTGALDSFIQRNTPHLFAPGALQRLAEEMNSELVSIRDAAIAKACDTGLDQKPAMIAKGVDFGWLTIRVVEPDPCRWEVDPRDLAGVADDLVVRPFQWKGSDATLRGFNRGAAHNELGMQAVELVGYGVDGDFDQVTDEMTVGDQTALAIYLAAQPRPVTLIELKNLGLIELSAELDASIRRGEQAFKAIACSSCHTPRLLIDDPIFREPSLNPNYRDTVFPSGLDPVSEALDPNLAVSFDLTADQPDNIVERPDGSLFHMGAFRVDRHGRAVVRLFGDLKYHDMGEDLAENIDETGTGRSTWLTKELWGVGSTGPWLHDGRASTLTEAILEHGGEADDSRRKFETLEPSQQQDVIAFLENLVLFKLPEEDDG